MVMVELVLGKLRMVACFLQKTRNMVARMNIARIVPEISVSVDNG